MPPAAASRRALQLALIPPLLYMAFLFGLSSIPGGEHDVFGYSFELNPQLGNFLHLPAYFILGVLWKLTFATWGVAPGRGTGLAIFLGALFGASDEFHQSFVPGRCMDARD